MVGTASGIFFMIKGQPPRSATFDIVSKSLIRMDFNALGLSAPFLELDKEVEPL